jgi:hypothetical protein
VLPEREGEMMSRRGRNDVVKRVEWCQREMWIASRREWGRRQNIAHKSQGYPRKS